jgi:serine/threonine protein kinase
MTRPRTSEGFVEEGRILARLRHPNIVAVYGAETHEGRDGVWMELIHGRTYEEIVRIDGPLGPREAALIGADLCRAVGVVHTAGISHRDITARNIMREVGGRVVLLDFGAGRRWSIEESSLRLAGTPLYLPPEVLMQGANPSASTDFYSIGVLLFYLTTGTFPIEAATFSDLKAAHAAGKYRRLHDVRADLPASFVAVVWSARSIPILVRDSRTRSRWRMHCFARWTSNQLARQPARKFHGASSGRSVVPFLHGRRCWSPRSQSPSRSVSTGSDLRRLRRAEFVRCRTRSGLSLRAISTWRMRQGSAAPGPKQRLCMNGLRRCSAKPLEQTMSRFAR